MHYKEGHSKKPMVKMEKKGMSHMGAFGKDMKKMHSEDLKSSGKKKNVKVF